ncbi:MAG TPA: SDR family oxidoreductase [Gammaproteobacteria bacterium]|nr:SDR family oxidoreductase [Gammaproteobacteria bacterium]
MLLNKTYIVTGASSGIGKAISEMLLCQNASVIGISRTVKPVASQARFKAVNMDFTRPKDYESSLKAIVRDAQGLEGCVCAAGLGRFGALEQFSFSQMQAMMHINFMAHAALLRYILPVLKRKRRGDVLIIGSEAALDGGKNGAMYCASKFALRGLAQALREECSKQGVRVNLINPGMVKTAFFEDLSFAPGDDRENYLTAEDVANTARLIFCSPASVVFDEVNLSPLKKVINFHS